MLLEPTLPPARHHADTIQAQEKEPIFCRARCCAGELASAPATDYWYWRSSEHRFEAFRTRSLDGLL
jgi:hypothetical protein